MERDSAPAAGNGAEPIAIVGFGGVFPGARSLDEFWQLIERGVDTSRPVPAGRWVLDPQTIQSPVPGTPDRVLTDRGCFIEGFQLDPAGLNLPAELLSALDPSVQLLLAAGRNAFASARMETVDRRRVGVVVGNIVLPTESASKRCEEVLGKSEVHLAECPTSPPSLTSPTSPNTSDFARHPSFSSSASGLLSRALGLGAAAFALDAACASSLYALKLACDELRAGRTDAMLAGGLSRPDSLYTQMGFSQLRALAPTGRCAPFDAAGSGLIVGEGAGVLVLKRLADALGDGDTIHAVIRGIGLSNDLEGNLLSPSSEGQLRALKQAYQQAGWSPDQVDFIECHATGTPVGDAVEFASLVQLWRGVVAPTSNLFASAASPLGISQPEPSRAGQPGQCVLGAVKANIGHLLTAAGSASLIKVLLALKHQTLPATANFRQPSPKIQLAGSPFRILQQSQPWPRRDDHTPRRAAINGFGFGGINAHVLIEEWLDPAAPDSPMRRSADFQSAVSPTSSRQAAAAGTTLASFPATQAGSTAVQPTGSLRCDPAVAIVGLAVQAGPWPSLRAFQQRVLGDENSSDLPPADLSIPLNRFRIPPKELAELLPQQALMLEVGRAALADAATTKPAPERAAVFIGLGLDARTTDYHHRWVSLAQGRVPLGPPLTADRTLGALAGTNASRIAKEFHFGGPAFTVSAEEFSGVQALELAVRALQSGEADQALAGAVDFSADPRVSAAGSKPPAEGAVALVLKRLADARRHGDRIYAVVRDVGQTGASAELEPRSRGRSSHSAPASWRAAVVCRCGEATEKRQPTAALQDAGATIEPPQVGAATALLSVVQAAFALYHEILLTTPRRYWVRDRADGPRRAGVSASSMDGGFMHVVLEECEEQSSERARIELSQPVGVCGETLFVVEAETQASLGGDLENLRALALATAGEASLTLARKWWHEQAAGSAGGTPALRWRLALIAQDTAQLLRLLDSATACVQNGSAPAEGSLPRTDRDRLFFTPPEQRIQGGIAFIFPGAGNTFPEMGRELALQWPEILRAQDRENERLASQMCADRFWNVASANAVGTERGHSCPLGQPVRPEAADKNGLPPVADHFWNAASTGAIGTDHRAVICGQVALGTMVSDLAVSFGLQPDAVVGYSLGEATGLFALRAWTARDAMLARVSQSTLFSEDLTGKPEQLRRVWQVPEGQPVEWQAGLVDCPAADVRAAIAGRERSYILIVNTPGECVIGGDAAEIRALVAKLDCHWWPLEGVSTVHCELLRPFKQAYRELHLFPTTAPAGVRFFSGGWGREYVPDREEAAEAIVAQASECVDFPRVVRAAYDAGMRFFLEMGPGNSCSRMIGQILAGRPHVARSLCASAQEPVLGVLRVLGQLAAEGVAVDLAKLYGAAAGANEPPEQAAEGQPALVRIPIVSPLFSLPLKAVVVRVPSRGVGKAAQSGNAASGDAAYSVALPGAAVLAAQGDPFEMEFFKGMTEAQSAAVSAHQAYLSFSQGVFQTHSQTVETQLALISALEKVVSGTGFQPVSSEPAGSLFHSAAAPVLDRAACLEFARGAAASVLGAEFRAVDTFPTRVRLPDEPLMLVDRILGIHGEARSMTHGRVVTEHDILPDAWYLDCGRIPTCIAVEAGQADLFLSGYLGIDFETQGRAVYRLLDAKVCFHRSLPGPGAVIHYDIRIDGFFRQGNTWLFRFNFEATVGGQSFLTMTDGCAGFFSAEELAGGRGIVRTAMDLQPMPGKRAADWEEFVAVGVESYSSQQLEALQAGDLPKCFGPQFAALTLRRPITLPVGRMKLVHWIPHLDPAGGRFGLGLVRGEADIHPDDWFLTCHFVDDRVMPGTLMFECCLHTLRVFLLRLGWVVEEGAAVLEPVPGVVSQLKCRGQVLDTTAVVTYEVSIKEIGFRPEPYVIADALMYADGKAIVEISNMSLRYAGVTREDFRRTWSQSSPAGPEMPTNGKSFLTPSAVASESAEKPALYGPERILAFAIGKPSEAFGEPYRVFDAQRRIARLPGPPYQFLDRITAVTGEPFKMVPGGVAVAEYDVPSEAWYFPANRQGDMPFAVLLEIALQPCGWLAAYVGSALTSETDLSFRNLGGTGKQLVSVTQATGTLTTRVKLTRMSSSAGMIIQWFDLEVRSKSGLIYQGDTYFGFFPAAALAKQEGIRDAKLYPLSPEESARSQSLTYPAQPPFASQQLRMVDNIETYLANGGPKGLGFIRATKRVVPEEWFFKAHFYQDPVVPGSLGLESFLQLLKFLAVERWGHTEGTRWEAVAIAEPHEWVYRGQIIPADKLVTIEAVVTTVDEAARLLTADGFLSVDGRVIYGMKHFTVRPRN